MERRPLVIINGRRQELPAGDTLPGAAAPETALVDGGSLETASLEAPALIVDFGSLETPP